MQRQPKIRTLTRTSLYLLPLLFFTIASASTTSATPLSPHNEMTSSVTHVWVEPQSGYTFFDAAVTGAQHSIDLSIYELNDADIEQRLIARARDGVDVHVILNAAYEGKSENGSAASLLRRGSVHVTWAPSGQIFHAKYLVVDDKNAYIGTGNLVTSDYLTTRDFWVEDKNIRDVDAITATFNGDLTNAGGSAAGTAGLVWSPGSTDALVSLIGSAQHSLLVENEEMDSPPIEIALAAAAKRGVDTKVVMSADASWTAALNQLARAGVHISLHHGAQLYIHAKVICADCTKTTGQVFIGSENFSTSSLVYNRELGLITSTRSAITKIKQAVDIDFASGTQLP
jgi:phosphatidylserine/phosphatidylglycerophosphate/cardiolipin synthase-like enzyme